MIKMNKTNNNGYKRIVSNKEGQNIVTINI